MITQYLFKFKEIIEIMHVSYVWVMYGTVCPLDAFSSALEMRSLARRTGRSRDRRETYHLHHHLHLT